MTATKPPHNSTLNNFDLIRLFAATQVAIGHIVYHLNVQVSGVALLQYFPGVPIFFFISGFLIYQSFANIKYERFRIFFVNRFLRMYPALLFCFLISILALFLSGYLESQDYELGDLLIWSAAQISFLQSYDPDFLREFGVGVLNGSLWTISVELQFYILTPFLFFTFTKNKKIWFVILLGFILANSIHTIFGDQASLLHRLFGASFIPWFYMFMLGAYLSTNKKLQTRILSVNIFVWLTLYIASYALAKRLGLGTGNDINVMSYILLCALIFKLAYSRPTLSKKILKQNDISYGIYIYHMPIVNLLLFLNVKETTGAFAVAIAVLLLVSLFSWFLIEKPALRLKRVALRRYD